MLPGVHLIASLLQCWIAGTLHHRVSNMLFCRLLQQAVTTDPHPLHDLQRLADPQVVTST